jgi:predicted aspartyl protease
MRPLAALLALVLAGLPAAQAQAPASYYLVKLNRSSDNHLETPVKINGKEGHLILDTGASTTFIDSTAVGRFRLQPRDSDQKVSRISGRPTSYDVAQAQSFAIGEIPVPIQEVGVVTHELGTRRRSATDRGAQGVLGCDVLRRLRAVVAVYYMRLYLPRSVGSSVQAELGAAGFVPVRLDVLNGVLTVAGKVNGKDTRLLVDTGGFTSLFDAAFLRSAGVGLSGGAQKQTGSLLTVQNLQAGQIDSLHLGGYEARNVTVAADKLSEERKSGRGLVYLEAVDGILGADFLAINNALIDYGAMKMWLRLGGVKTKQYR